MRVTLRGPIHGIADDERGGVLVLFALWLPLTILLLTFVADVGNWFEHKRHLQLQADAAAWAGAGAFNFPCLNPAIETEVRKYGGDLKKALHSLAKQFGITTPRKAKKPKDKPAKASSDSLFWKL